MMISFITSPQLLAATNSQRKKGCSIVLQIELEFHLQESSMVKLFIKNLQKHPTLHLTLYELRILNIEIWSEECQLWIWDDRHLWAMLLDFIYLHCRRLGAVTVILSSMFLPTQHLGLYWDQTKLWFIIQCSQFVLSARQIRAKHKLSRN